MKRCFAVPFEWNLLKCGSAAAQCGEACLTVTAVNQSEATPRSRGVASTKIVVALDGKA